MARGTFSPRCGRTHRTGRAPLVFLGAGAAVCLLCSSACYGFLAGAAHRGVEVAAGRGRCRGGVARRAFEFGLAKSEGHQSLVMEQEEGGVRVSTHGPLYYGSYNTILGDKELPAKGRSYWEVKIVEKPSDAWEYIGVAEPSADVAVPLAVNKKGAGWFWGSTLSETILYTYLEMTEEMNKRDIEKFKILKTKYRRDEFEYKVKLDMAEYAADHFNPKVIKGTHIGLPGIALPPFKNGTVVGVDVDMDKGSLAFWADGEYLGVMKEVTGAPIDIRGKKVVPALSVFGRTTGETDQYTVMEVRSGIEPPPRPE